MPDSGERRLALGWGRVAEDAVAAKLVERGWTVLERNFLAQGGELDIIVERGGKLRFVEVRAREAGTHDAIESITPTKQRRMRVAAEVWMLARTVPFAEVAFLIAAVELDSGRVRRIEWIDDAF